MLLAVALLLLLLAVVEAVEKCPVFVCATHTHTVASRCPDLVWSGLVLGRARRAVCHRQLLSYLANNGTC